jgi:hypothetical protein
VELELLTYILFSNHSRDWQKAGEATGSILRAKRRIVCLRILQLSVKKEKQALLAGICSAMSWRQITPAD